MKETDHEARSDFLRDLPSGYARFKFINSRKEDPGKIIIVENNDLFARIAGLKDHEVKDASIDGLFPGIHSRIFKLLSRTGNDQPKRISFEEFTPIRKRWFMVTLIFYPPDDIVALFNDVTNRKIIEDDLRKSEQRFRSLYENSTIGLYRTTPEGEVIMANPALLKILEYERFEDLAARNLEKDGLYPIYPRSFFKDKIEKLGEVRGLELMWKTRTGRTIFIRESAKAFRDNDGKVLYYEGTVEDITERKTAEMQISELNEIFLELGVDPSRNIDAIVKKACQILNGSFSIYSKHDPSLNTNSIISSFNVPESLKKSMMQHGDICNMAGLAEKEGSYIEEDCRSINYPDLREYCRQTGIRSFIGFPVKAEDTAPGSLCVIFKTPRRFSVTEIKIIATLAKALSLDQKRFYLEKQLKESESRYRKFVYNLQGIAFESDLKLKPNFMHGRVSELTGYKENDFLNEKISWHDIILPKDIHIINQSIEKLKASPGLSLENEYRVELRNGKIKWIRHYIMSTKGAPGNRCLLQSVVFDITHIKEFEQNLEKAKNDAEVANLSKSQFLANMSHEIRTPLHAIIGFTEMMAADEKDPRRQEMLKIIEDSGNQLLYLINDLLDLSQIESGKLNLIHDEFRVEKLVKDVLSYFRKKALEKRIKITSKLSGCDDLVVVSDPFKIRQIIVNLVSNAIKFTDRGSVIIEVVCNEIAQGNVNAQIKVRDTGMGIKPEYLQVIFEEFRQLDNYLTKREKGAGLGLSIVKRLVSLLKGAIDVESEPGKGSVFTVTLPLKKGILQKDQKMTTAGNERTDLPAAAGHIRILLAEDNEANQFLIKALAKAKGWSIVAVGNGEEALREFEKQEFDLILMDVQMPVMDGYEATRAIRNREKSKGTHVPIIALTAYAMKSDKEECIRAGMDSYIAKPFNKSDFFDKISEIMSKKS